MNADLFPPSLSYPEIHLMTPQLFGEGPDILIGSHWTNVPKFDLQ